MRFVEHEITKITSQQVDGIVVFVMFNQQVIDTFDTYHSQQL